MGLEGRLGPRALAWTCRSKWPRQILPLMTGHVLDKGSLVGFVNVQGLRVEEPAMQGPGLASRMRWSQRCCAPSACGGWWLPMPLSPAGMFFAATASSAGSFVILHVLAAGMTMLWSSKVGTDTYAGLIPLETYARPIHSWKLPAIVRRCS